MPSNLADPMLDLTSPLLPRIVLCPSYHHFTSYAHALFSSEDWSSIMATLFWGALQTLKKPPIRTIDGNYRVITLIFTKCGNLLLSLENYALFSLPSIFTKKLYTYTLSNILYLGKPPGNIISNYHRTFIHICMHAYYPSY